MLFNSLSYLIGMINYISMTVKDMFDCYVSGYALGVVK